MAEEGSIASREYATWVSHLVPAVRQVSPELVPAIYTRRSVSPGLRSSLGCKCRTAEPSLQLRGRRRGYALPLQQGNVERITSVGGMLDRRQQRRGRLLKIGFAVIGRHDLEGRSKAHHRTKGLGLGFW